MAPRQTVVFSTITTKLEELEEEEHVHFLRNCTLSWSNLRYIGS